VQSVKQVAVTTVLLENDSGRRAKSRMRSGTVEAIIKFGVVMGASATARRRPSLRHKRTSADTDSLSFEC